MKVHKIVDVQIKESDPDTGKPYLELKFYDPAIPTINISCNLAELLSGAARGAMARYEDLKSGKK